MYLAYMFTMKKKDNIFNDNIKNHVALLVFMVSIFNTLRLLNTQMLVCHWFIQYIFVCSVAHNYLNHCYVIFDLVTGNNSQWNVDQNTTTAIQENVLFQSHCVNAIDVVEV